MIFQYAIKAVASLSSYFCSTNRDSSGPRTTLILHIVAECLETILLHNCPGASGLGYLFPLALFSNIGLIGLYLFVRLGSQNKLAPSKHASDVCFALSTWCLYKSCVFSVLFAFCIPFRHLLLFHYIIFFSSCKICLQIASRSTSDSAKKFARDNAVLLYPLAISAILGLILMTGCKEARFTWWNVISLSIVVIGAELNWVTVMIKEKNSKISYCLDHWTHLNHFHLPIIVLKKDYSVPYFNKAARDYFSTIAQENFSEYFNNLFESSTTKSKGNESLRKHIDLLFDNLSVPSSSRNYISSVKEYAPRESPLIPSYGVIRKKQLKEIKTQVAIFEVEHLSEDQESLFCIFNDIIDPEDYMKMKLILRNSDYISSQVSKMMKRNEEALMEGGKELRERFGMGLGEEEIKVPERNYSGNSLLGNSCTPSTITGRNVGKPRNEEPVDKFVQLISSHSQRMTTTLDLWHDLLLIQKGGFRKTDGILDLEGMVEDIYDLMKWNLESKGVKLKINFECHKMSTPLGNRSVPGVDVKRFQKLLLGQIQVGMLHCSGMQKTLGVKAEIDDSRIAVTLTHPAEPIDQREEEDFLLYMMKEVAKAIGAMVTKEGPHEEEKGDPSQERIILEMNYEKSQTEDSNSLCGFPVGSPTDSNCIESFAEIVAKEQAARRRMTKKTSSGDVRKSLFFLSKQNNGSPTRKKSGKEWIGLEFESQSFGNLKSLNSERSEPQAEIPEEYPEGDPKPLPEPINNRTQQIRKSRTYGSQYKMVAQNVLGLIIGDNEKLAKLISSELKRIGVHEIIRTKTAEEFLNRKIMYNIKKGCTTATIFVDLCQISAFAIKRVKECMVKGYLQELGKIERIVVVGSRCGECYFCMGKKEEAKVVREIECTLGPPHCSYAINRILESLRLYQHFL